MINRRILTGFFLLAIIFSSVWVQTARAATITVDTTNDVLDAAGVCASVTPATLPGPDGVTSLREAMCAANTNPGEDTINFAIPGAGIQTINLGSALPQLIDGDTTINGYTQFGAMPANGSTPATILIAINGTGIANNGFNVTSTGNEIRGLAIYGFMFNEIYMVNQGGGIAMDNVIAGNYLGSDPSGLVCPVNKGFNGVFIGQAAQNNLIGGDTPADRNLILCNGWEGVGIHGSGTIENVVSGNYIGVGPLGTTAMPNTLDGVRIYGGAQDNIIGGVSVGERNIISGNTRDGVRIVGEGTIGNQVLGNYIGVEPDGASAQSNTNYGVYLGGGAQENLIGGDTPGERNVISQNLVGVVISDTTTISNTVSGNFIGVDFSGTLDTGNAEEGIRINGAQNNHIGGDSPGEGNLISGNEGSGIEISDSGTTGNVVRGNYIGVDQSGTADVSNERYGINIVAGAQGNIVGGDSAGARNVISSNLSGVRIHGAGTDGNIVQGNYLGTDAAGLVDLGNEHYGVYIARGAQNNIIGGDRNAGEGNLISGNGSTGVFISDEATNGNIIAGNFIGTDVTGLVALGNVFDGVSLTNDLHNNVIGGDTAGERNVISGNGDDGVSFVNDAADNIVSSNYIGLGVDGSTLLPNTDNGIALGSRAQNNTIGGDLPGERNIISGNNGYGITIEGHDNIITGNYIGTDAGGNAARGNLADGIYLTDEADNNVIGGNTAGERNLISGNGDDGVSLDGAASNTVSGNFIGVNSSGSIVLPNADYGIYMGDGAQNNTIGGTTAAEGNVISGNVDAGLYVAGEATSDNVIAYNYIGTDPTGIADLGNTQQGIELDFGTHDNTIGPGNLIAHNGYDGIFVDKDTTIGNMITQNRIYSNIDDGIYLSEGAHGGITPPEITNTIFSSGIYTISGTACPSCTVEVFGNSTTDGEGEFYLGSTTAGGGGAFEPHAAFPALSLPHGHRDRCNRRHFGIFGCFCIDGSAVLLTVDPEGLPVKNEPRLRFMRKGCRSCQLIEK